MSTGAFTVFFIKFHMLSTHSQLSKRRESFSSVGVLCVYNTFTFVTIPNPSIMAKFIGKGASIFFWVLDRSSYDGVLVALGVWCTLTGRVIGNFDGHRLRNTCQGNRDFKERFRHVSCTCIHAAETLLIAAASTSEHIHTGRLEKFVGCCTQLFGNFHTGFPRHTLSLLPFFIYDWINLHLFGSI